MPNIIMPGDLNGISLAEATHAAREETVKLAAKNRHPDQDILERQDMAAGREMEVGHFITKLQHLNPELQVRKGGVENAVAVCMKVPVSEDFPTGWKYVTGFYVNKPLPEYSSVTTDQFGVAHKEIRGWRSVLMSLILAGALDRKKVDITFGPALGQRTDLWYRSLQANEK